MLCSYWRKSYRLPDLTNSGSKFNLTNKRQFIFFERKQLQVLDNAWMKWTPSFLSQIKCWNTIAKPNWYAGLIKTVKIMENILRFMSLFRVYKDIYRERAPSFSSPWTIKQRVTTNWLQPIMSPTKAVSIRRALGKRYRVTTPTMIRVHLPAGKPEASGSGRQVPHLART